MNKIDKLTQKIFSKFNDDSLFYCNIYLTATEENNAVVLFDMEGFILKVCLDEVKTEYTMPEDSYVLVSEMCIDENENVIHLVTVVGVISYTTVIIRYICLVRNTNSQF